MSFPVFLTVLLAQTAAQSKPVAFDPSHLLKTFRCDFTESDGRRTSAKGVTTLAKGERFSDLVVDNVDYEKGTAR